MLTSLLADKIIRLENEKLGFLVNEYIKPPCNSSLSMSFISKISSEEEVEVGRASPFAESDEVDEEGALEINEGGVEGSVSFDLRFVLNFVTGERE